MTATYPARAQRRYRILTAVSVCLVVLCWEALVAVGQLPAYLLPAPHQIGLRLTHELAAPPIWRHIAATTSVASMAVLLAVGLGVFLSWVSYHVAAVRAVTRWIITSSQAVPVIALAPLLFLWIPDEFWARVGVAVVITFFPVYATTETALSRIPRELREVASLEGVSVWNGWLWYEAALAAPVVLAGLRSSMVLATTGAVVAEYLGGRYGLGALLNIARGLFDTTLVFVTVVVLIVITSGYALVFHGIERVILRSLEGE